MISSTAFSKCLPLFTSPHSIQLFPLSLLHKLAIALLVLLIRPFAFIHVSYLGQELIPNLGLLHLINLSVSYPPRFLLLSLWCITSFTLTRWCPLYIVARQMWKIWKFPSFICGLPSLHYPSLLWEGILYLGFQTVLIHRIWMKV